jgi:glycosyltransferase involved in cell wall biosynthesis
MISLIVASWNRTVEPERLLKSLDDQTYREFEVIMGDQNQDQRLDTVVRTHPDLRVKHLRLERGLSRARNAALPLVGGDIIAFPDDDCWYSPELLAKVKSWFEEHPEFAVLFTATRDGDGELMAPKFPLKRGACTKASVLRCAVTFNGFMRLRSVLFGRISAPARPLHTSPVRISTILFGLSSAASLHGMNLLSRCITRV